MKLTLLFLFSSLLMASCISLHRSNKSGYSDNNESFSKRNYKTNDRYSHGQTNINSQSRLHDLERKLDSKMEREQYAKILPWLKSEDEKIEFLSLPGIENRQNWINQKKIWQRAQMPTQEYKDLIDAQDIAIGMPMDFVRKSWGDPQLIESSGNPTFKNERWKYTRHVSTSQGFKQERRYVYFEGGRVVGWETE